MTDDCIDVELASFLPSMSGVWAARCEHMKQIVVLCSWKRTPTPPLLPCNINDHCNRNDDCNVTNHDIVSEKLFWINYVAYSKILNHYDVFFENGLINALQN